MLRETQKSPKLTPTVMFLCIHDTGIHLKNSKSNSTFTQFTLLISFIKIGPNLKFKHLCCFHGYGDNLGNYNSNTKSVVYICHSTFLLLSLKLLTFFSNYCSFRGNRSHFTNFKLTVAIIDFNYMLFSSVYIKLYF